MPLSQVREGMRCTGLSVVRGTEISSFDVLVEDVVEDESAAGGSLILVRVSGPAVEATGVGPGFSGSPIYCPGPDGMRRNAGAISFLVGEFGNRLALATPIEKLLAEPADPPRAATRPAPPVRGARPLAGPLTVTGLGPRPLATLRAAARSARRTVIAAPPAPLRSFPPQDLRPGASLAVGLATGDVNLGAVGTVAYRDGDRVWGFGHPLDLAGPRSLLLQDAYVYTVVNNPNGDLGTSYKLAAPGHPLGRLANDGPAGVVGRLGALPRTVPLTVRATDLDARRSSTTRVDFADETDVDQPLGTAPITLLGPLVAGQAAAARLGGAPARLSAAACARIGLRERARPLRFCNRYVATGAPGEELSGAAEWIALDLLQALGMVEDFRLGALHLTGVEVDAKLRRGLQQAFIVGASAPRTVRAGGRLRVRLRLRRVRGGPERASVTVPVPRRARPGLRRLTVIGTADDDEAALAEGLGAAMAEGEQGGSGAAQRPGGDPGLRSVEQLAAAVAAIGRFDGLRVRFAGRERRLRARGTALRVSGRADLRVRVAARRQDAPAAGRRGR